MRVISFCADGIREAAAKGFYDWAVDQDADIICFIYRDEVYNPETTQKKGIAEILIAKHRNGPVGEIELKWFPEYTKFADLSNR